MRHIDIATNTGMKQLMAIAAVGLFPTAIWAENALTAIEVPSERPYPYKILDLQPGASLEDVTAVFSERSDSEPTGESEILRVQSPDGNVFEFTYELFRRIGDVGVNGRLAKADQDQLTAHLSSDVMEQRPLSISRALRMPSAQLPAPLELKAQLEETYGPPSQFEMRGNDMTITYAWGEDGFIPDLENEPEREISITQNGTAKRLSYVPCQRSRSYDRGVEYRFAYPREKETMIGCVAIFKINYSGDPGSTGISFILEDYELARMHTETLDGQIVEALTGTAVEASDLDL